MMHSGVMSEIALTDTEKRLLQDYKKKSSNVLVREKSGALLLLDELVPVDTVSRFAERQPSTIQTWTRQWKKTRMESVVTGHAGNWNASKLTPEQRQEVAEVLSQPPSEVGLPGEFWSVPKLANWVATRFDVVYESPTSYHYLLKHAGLSYHKPQVSDQRQASPSKVEVRLKEIDEELKDAYDDDDSMVMAADETRIEHEAIIRQAWIERGKKTKLKVNRARQSQSYIGFLDQKTGKVDLHSVDWQQSSTIVGALKSLVEDYPDKKIHIVWDNASWHRSKELRSHLGPGNPLENIHFHYLPAYSPEHNPIEFVWGEAKNNISNEQRLRFSQTKQAFEEFVRGNTFPYRLVRF